MKYQKVEIGIQVASELEEMPAEVKKLMDSACSATERAYAPYSQFNVGAAVLLENGEMISGSNQENAAYPSGLCAERVVLYYANSRFPGVPIRHLVIAARNAGGFVTNPISPCGACRQVMLETESRQSFSMKVWLVGSEIVVQLPSAISLLPFAFTSAELKPNR